MARSKNTPFLLLLPLLLLGAGCGTSAEETPDPTPTLGDGAQNAFEDADNDGFLVGDDCDDNDASAYPGAAESCNGGDDDCDETIDEGFDKDGDGSLDQDLCATQGGDDCDDSDPFTGPGASESCDGDDNDCDETIDENPEDGTRYYLDADGDGLGDADNTLSFCEGGSVPADYVDNKLDCDDSDADIGRPIQWYEDTDGDGFGVDDTAVTACDSPGSTYVDAGGDCDDSDAEMAPDASEICDEEDNDCDGTTDEGVQTSYFLDDDDDGYGEDASETLACAAPSEDYVTVAGDCDDTRAIVNPGQTDFCDDLDNDCDGSTDEPDNQSITRWYEDADGDGFGNPSVSERTCDQPANYVLDATDCDDTEQSINPDGTEICGDDIDQDCSGADLACD